MPDDGVSTPSPSRDGAALAAADASAPEVHPDAAPDAHPDAPAAPDCQDRDGDGYFAGPDCPGVQGCDDGAATTNPGADDLCNFVDDDCDGEVDEDGRDCGAPCQPVMDCYSTCTAAGGGSDGCWTDCSASAGNPVCDTCYNDMVACGSENGCFPGGGWDATCMAEHCPGKYEATTI